MHMHTQPSVALTYSTLFLVDYWVYNDWQTLMHLYAPYITMHTKHMSLIRVVFVYFLSRSTIHSTDWSTINKHILWFSSANWVSLESGHHYPSNFKTKLPRNSNFEFVQNCSKVPLLVHFYVKQTCTKVPIKIFGLWPFLPMRVHTCLRVVSFCPGVNIPS